MIYSTAGRIRGPVEEAQGPRESRVMALKLDELIRAAEGARTGFVDLDHMSDKELEAVQKEFSGCAKNMPHLSTTISPTSSTPWPRRRGGKKKK